VSEPDPAAPSEPLGPERTVRLLGAASVGGAPVAYVVVLGAVVAVLSFIPFSVALSAGGSFPMAQGVYPLMGWLLGPAGGAVASAMGSLVGLFLAPHTAGIPWLTVGGAATGALFAGCIVARGRRALALGAVLLVAGETWLFSHHATVANGVRPGIFLLAYLAHFAAMVLFLLPTRRWIGRLIESPDLGRVWLGLFLGTWCATSLMMFSESFVSYWLLNWPSPLFVMFIGIIPLEEAARSGIGAVIGTGVIAGLRSIALPRPPGARY
jgi:hypothetical protein